jgi:hypothetical protein
MIMDNLRLESTSAADVRLFVDVVDKCERTVFIWSSRSTTRRSSAVISAFRFEEAGRARGVVRSMADDNAIVGRADQGEKT